MGPKLSLIPKQEARQNHKSPRLSRQLFYQPSQKIHEHRPSRDLALIPILISHLHNQLGGSGVEEVSSAVKANMDGQTTAIAEVIEAVETNTTIVPMSRDLSQLLPHELLREVVIAEEHI